MHLRSTNKLKSILLAIFVVALSIIACNLQLPTPPPLPETSTNVPSETPPPATEIPSPIPPLTPVPTDETILTRIEPEVTLSAVQLPDGSAIYLHPGTEFEITKLAGLTAGATGHELIIRRGQILVISQLPAGEWFTIVSSNGHIGRVTGSIILVDYEAALNQFTVVCIEGSCELGMDIQNLLRLSARDRGWFDANGNFQGPFDVDMNDLRRIYGTLIPDALQVPPAADTPTPTSTPDFAASATAACDEFQVEFPGTPCP